MTAFAVRKSIVINAPLDEVHATVRDFHRWPLWSPWLIVEPDCTVVNAADGRSYTWDGKIVGAGEMAIVDEDAPRIIRYRLTFLRPWESVADVSFSFAEKDGGTEATWSMDSALPWFMFWMKDMMTAFVGLDYQRGLLMLKDYLETGAVPSKLDFIGRQRFVGFRYLGVRTRCAIAELGPGMGRDLETVSGAMTEAGVQPSGKGFSIYHKFAPAKDVVEYTSGFPVESVPGDLPAGIVAGELSTGEVYSVKHTGPYRHLGNLWAGGMMHGQAKVFQQDKKIHPFEVYETLPGEVADDEVVTVAHFPVK